MYLNNILLHTFYTFVNLLTIFLYDILNIGDHMKNTSMPKVILIILLSFVPVVFIIGGLINLFVVKDNAQAIGLIISGIVFGIIGFIIYYFENKNLTYMAKLKSENIYKDAHIDSLEQEENSITLISSVIENEIKYTFTSIYITKNIAIAEEIKEKTLNSNQTNIKIWVDLEKYKSFEYNIEEFIFNLGVDTKLELSAWSANQEKNQVNS